MFTEVEYVAAKILELVRSGRCRFRDIAVAARNLACVCVYGGSVYM